MVLILGGVIFFSGLLSRYKNADTIRSTQKSEAEVPKKAKTTGALILGILLMILGISGILFMGFILLFLIAFAATNLIAPVVGLLLLSVLLLILGIRMLRQN